MSKNTCKNPEDLRGHASSFGVQKKTTKDNKTKLDLNGPTDVDDGTRETNAIYH